MEEFSKLFLYIPGIVIFLVGSGQVRGWLRNLKTGNGSAGKVLACSHIIKKDKKDREIYNFYDVQVEYTDPRTKGKIRMNVKSPTEYAVSQPVKVFYGADGKPVLADSEETPVFHPLVAMAGGALLILLALEQNRGREIPAMLCLSAIMIGAGISLLWHFTFLKKRKLEPLEAEIVDVYSRQLSKETKIIRGSRFTYYPVVRYNLDGQDVIRRCRVNSSSEKSFKTGDKMKLYLDRASGSVSEHRANPVMAVSGACLLICGILAGTSILSQILK